MTYTALSEKSKVARSTLFYRKNGRLSREAKARKQQYLTPPEEKTLVKYLVRMSNLGFPLPIKYIPSLAFTIARGRKPNPPSKNWAKRFEERQPELQSRKVKPVDWKCHDINIYDKITQWFEMINKELQDPDVRPENVYNMDETGVMLSMLGSVKVLVSRNDLRDYRGAGVKRTIVTAIECVSADGRALLPMVIWPATSHRSNWTTYPTPGWHYAFSENGYTDSKISLEWLKCVFDPQTKAQAQQKPRILISDGFGTHETLEILEYCFENNILPCRLPSHTSHKLQPCDVGVFAPLKAAYRDEVERLYRGGANTVGKEHFTYLYGPAREKALTPRNIKAGWKKTGLLPFDPDKVLGNIRKPPAEPNVQKVDEVNVGSSVQDEVLLTPATPVTPVTTEAFTSLRSLIERHAHANDEMSKQRLQRCLQKLTNATEMSFAERDLLVDENKLLLKQNNEAKVRRSTKSTVVGKAKVMRYEDIEVAQAKRAEKEEAKAKGKGRRGRKRKSTGQEADTEEPGADTLLGLGIEPEADTPQPKAKRKRKSKKAVPEVAATEADILEARDNVSQMSEALNTPYASMMWTNDVQVAPVARMY